MQTLPAFGFGDPFADPLRSPPQEAGQHRQFGMADPQGAGGHLKQADLAAVGVEQHQPLESGRRQVLAHGLHQGDQHLRRQAQGAGEAPVLGRKADALGG